MGCSSKLAECLPCCYGYVVLTAVGSVFVNVWHAHNVMRARKKFGVEVCKTWQRIFECMILTEISVSLDLLIHAEISSVFYYNMWN